MILKRSLLIFPALFLFLLFAQNRIYAASFSFTAGGDWGTGTDTDKVLNGIAGAGTDFTICIGDLSYNSVSPESAWCNYIKNHLGSAYPFELLVGNHEDGSPYESYGGAIDTFAACLPDRIGGITGIYGHQYYFDYPQTGPIARFILLEPDEYLNGSFVAYTAGNARYNWVASAIDSARASGIKWVIVGMHKIYLDMGDYRGDSLDGGDGIGPDLFNLFVNKKVDLVLQAHYHTYQRTKQLALGTNCPAINLNYNANCVANASTNTYIKDAGTVTVINGASGFSLYNINTSAPEAGYFTKWMGGNISSSYGYLKINVTDTQLTGQFVPTTGSFTDSFSITAGGGSPAPTPSLSPPPIPSPSTGTTPQPVGQTGNWSMVWNDEFNGSGVDLTKWRPNWLGSSDTAITPPVNSSELQCYDPAQATVSNGVLNLTAVSRSCNGKSYASGMVQTDGKYNFSYGYIEARMWTPAGSGMWPAFWTNGQSWPQDGEIDILESYGTDVSEYHYHYSGCGGDCGPGGEYTLTGATSGWHTYAVDWEPGVITWYYDGNQVWQYSLGIISSPHYIILNLGLESTPNPIPSILKTDYVRVWKKGTGASPSPVPSPSVTPACRADINKDKIVNLADLIQILGKFNTGCTGCTEDITADGRVNLADLQNILNLWGQRCP